MELLPIGRALWREKALVAAAVVLALVAAILVGQSRQGAQGGVASNELLVDAHDSTVSDLKRDTEPLVPRAAIIARILGADGVTERIADEAGVREDEISVLGPTPPVGGLPDQTAARRAAELSEGSTTQVQVQPADALPLLTVIAQAPGPEEAGRLVDATGGALESYVSEIQDRTEVPERRRLTVRPLGPTRFGQYDEPPGPFVPLAVFLLVLGALCAAILAGPRFEAWLRSKGIARRRPALPARVAANANGHGHGKRPGKGRKAVADAVEQARAGRGQRPQTSPASKRARHGAGRKSPAPKRSSGR